MTKSAYNLTMSETHFLSGRPTPSKTLVGVLCSTDQGQPLQLLFSADRLLDLGAVERILGGRISRSAGSPVTLNIGGQAASCASIANAPTLLDQALADQPMWHIETELGWVAMAQREIASHWPRTAVHVLTRPLASLTPELLENTAHITRQIENLTGRRVRKRLDETLEMPPLPHTATEIIRLKLDPDAGTNELAAAVETDASLAAQVVSWANSPYYAAPGQVASVADAVIRVLGYDMVINLALGLSLGKSVTPPKGRRGEPSFWTQSVYCAASMQALAQAIPPNHRPNVGLAYLSGLLFNFGQLVLTHVFPDQARDIERYQQVNPHVPSRYIDRHLLSLEREQLSAELLESWRLPEAVCDALRYQHQPTVNTENSRYSKLLFVATRLLAAHGRVSARPGDISDALLDELGLTRSVLDSTLTQVLGGAANLDSMARDLDA